MATHNSNESLDFEGRVAIITGSGGAAGLGQEIAFLLAQRHCKVVINGRRTEMVDATVQEIRNAGGEAVACYGSIAERKVCEQLVQAAIDSFGRLDIIVNNAAVSGGMKTAEEWTDDDYRYVMDTNIFGSWALTQIAWPHFKKQHYGRVIFTTSPTMLGVPNIVLYSSSKGAVFSMSRCLALEGKEHGILVNSYFPSALTQGSMDANKNNPAMVEAKQKYFQRRPVAEVAVWLAHEKMQRTGETITAGGPFFARLFVAETKGVVGLENEVTAEFVRDHFEEACDAKEQTTPASVMDWSANVIKRQSNK